MPTKPERTDLRSLINAFKKMEGRASVDMLCKVYAELPGALTEGTTRRQVAAVALLLDEAMPIGLTLEQDVERGRVRQALRLVSHGSSSTLASPLGDAMVQNVAEAIDTFLKSIGRRQPRAPRETESGLPHRSRRQRKRASDPTNASPALTITEATFRTPSGAPQELPRANADDRRFILNILEGKPAPLLGLRGTDKGSLNEETLGTLLAAYELNTSGADELRKRIAENMDPLSSVAKYARQEWRTVRDLFKSGDGQDPRVGAALMTLASHKKLFLEPANLDL